MRPVALKHEREGTWDPRGGTLELRCTNVNIPAGKLLDPWERVWLEEEILLLKTRLGELESKDFLTAGHTPWQRVEHEADTAAAHHDLEALEISLVCGRRVY